MFFACFLWAAQLFIPPLAVWYRLRLMYECFHRHHYYSPPPQDWVGTRIMRPNSFTFVTSWAVTNKSSSSVNILVRAQVARRQSGNIFSGLYPLSIVQLSATVRGRAGADLCWVVERPVRQKMCSGFLWGILTPIMAKLIQRQIKRACVLNSLLEPVVQWLSLWAFEVVIEH